VQVVATYGRLHHTFLQLNSYVESEIVSLIPQALSSLQGPRNKTIHSVLIIANQNLACQDQQLKSDLQANFSGQPCCRRQHALCRSKGVAIEMAENSGAMLPFVCEIVQQWGGGFLRWVGLLVLYDFTCTQTEHMQVPSLNFSQNCGHFPTLSIPTLLIPIWSTSHFVNSHFVNSNLVNFPLCQFPLCQFPFGQC